MPQAIADETRKARKVHMCDLCSRRINPGESYRRQFIVDSGDCWTWRQCAHCTILAGMLWNYTEWFRYCDEGVNADAITEWEPETIEQARLKIHWKHQWRTKSGELRPFPVLLASRSVEVRQASEAYL